MSEKYKWNESEFLTFLLMYCAHIDMEFQDHEKEMIQQLLDKEHYIEVRDVFRKSNDSECIEIIRSFKGLYFPTHNRKEALVDRVRKLFEVDGDYTQLERGVLGLLDRIL